MQVLRCRHNCISSLNHGLDGVPLLADLDLSCNNLKDYEFINQLKRKAPQLKHLNVSCNPLPLVKSASTFAAYRVQSELASEKVILREFQLDSYNGQVCEPVPSTCPEFS